MRSIVLHALLGLAAALSTTARAASSEDAPAFYVQAGGGYSIYKSALVQSNDTSILVNYGFGLFAGADHTVGMALQRQQATFAFDLNGSSIGYTHQDVHLRYRLGPLSAGVVFTESHWLIAAPADLDGDTRPDPDGTAIDLVDALGTGYGAFVGLSIPVARKNRVFVETTYALPQTVQAKALPADGTAGGALAEPDAALGARMEVDLGASIELMRKGGLAATAGFRYATYTLGLGGQSYTEQHTSTMLGLKSELDF